MITLTELRSGSSLRSSAQTVMASAISVTATIPAPCRVSSA